MINNLFFLCKYTVRLHLMSLSHFNYNFNIKRSFSCDVFAPIQQFIATKLQICIEICNLIISRKSNDDEIVAIINKQINQTNSNKNQITNTRWKRKNVVLIEPCTWHRKSLYKSKIRFNWIGKAYKLRIAYRKWG